MEAKNLKFLMKYYGDKQEVLANMLGYGVTQSRISEYKNGKRPIPYDIAEKISHRYGVTIEEFMSTDLELEYDLPQKLSLKLASTIRDKMFPFFTSKIAKNNANFNYAYAKTNELLEKIGEQNNISQIYEKQTALEKTVEIVIESYKKAWDEEKTYVALSNSISLILFVYSLYTPENIEVIQNIKYNSKTESLDIKQCLLKDPRKRNIDKFSTKKNSRIFSKYEKLVYSYIKTLKLNTRSSELGDFWLVMCCFLGFSDDTVNAKMRYETAGIMFYQQYMLDNRYTKELIEIFEEI